METSAESYEPAFRGKRDRKRDRKSKKQRIAKPISTSETETTTIDAEHPRASLLGLPKELLNYIIGLAVVKDPEEGPTEAIVELQRLKGSGYILRCETPSPALGRTCRVLESIVLPIYYGQNTFAFCSHYHTCHWLSSTRKRRGMSSIRRIRILFDVIGRHNVERLVEMELFLEDKTDRLALAVGCPFYAQACQWCRRILMDRIEDINGNTRQYKSGVGRLLALVRYFSMANSKRRLCSCGCKT